MRFGDKLRSRGRSAEPGVHSITLCLESGSESEKRRRLETRYLISQFKLFRVIHSFNIRVLVASVFRRLIYLERWRAKL